MSSTTPPPPQPSFAQIVLPPGFTLEQFQKLQSSLITIGITVAVAFAVVVWDYFAQLPDEIALYRTRDKKIWYAPATWFFVVLRYSGILATLPSLFFTSVQSQHCQVAVVTSQVGAVLVVASSGAIFCYRVFAIWSDVKIVQAGVSFMFLVMLGCWIAVATQYEAITGPPTPFGSNCQMLPIVTWAPISYASSVAFDTVVLVLTLARLHGNLATTKSKVGKQIYRDNLVYFLLTAVTNITVLSIQALGPSHDLIKPTAVPFSTLMTVTMGSRVFLNLKLFDQRQQKAEAGIPLSISSHGNGSQNRTITSSHQNVVIDVKGPYREDQGGYGGKA
ncbi:hypothetical protein Hypma_013481 [Hypsizygus marmoreus]|uniref:Uncharacterized protein n=1 Tax=Hypsizygus marmoreus TaxID=39966 RepID=A0A369JDJ0_HYPMA|nr:hypothetical protein Hypma_013481 [Hypsizygus marmoreus]